MDAATMSNKSILVMLAMCVASVASAQPTAPPPAPPVQSLRLALTVKSGADTRTHELVILDRGCGVVHQKAPSYDDDFQLCSTPTATGVSLAVEGTTRAGAIEYKQRSE